MKSLEEIRSKLVAELDEVNAKLDFYKFLKEWVDSEDGGLCKEFAYNECENVRLTKKQRKAVYDTLIQIPIDNEDI